MTTEKDAALGRVPGCKLANWQSEMLPQLFEGV
jgi:hypothetical protein